MLLSVLFHFFLLFVYHCPIQPLPQLTKIILPNIIPICQYLFFFIFLKYFFFLFSTTFSTFKKFKEHCIHKI